MNHFNSYLQLPTDELIWEIEPAHFIPDEIGYLINPRRLRGSDFLMRWAQGRWSEKIVMRALNQTSEFGVIPYGPSTVAPEDPVELEKFFEKMTVIEQEGKRPDLLLFDRETFEKTQKELIYKWGHIGKAAETPSSEMADVIPRAKVALEIENSLWVTSKMPGFGKPFSRYVRGKCRQRFLRNGKREFEIVA